MKYLLLILLPIIFIGCGGYKPLNIEKPILHEIVIETAPVITDAKIDSLRIEPPEFKYVKEISRGTYKTTNGSSATHIIGSETELKGVVNLVSANLTAIKSLRILNSIIQNREDKIALMVEYMNEQHEQSIMLYDKMKEMESLYIEENTQKKIILYSTSGIITALLLLLLF